MIKLLFSCEHGGNQIPEEFSPCFSNAGNDINSHKGIDFGALDTFNDFVANVSDFSVFSETCRLLVDLNRSLASPTLFSSYTEKLPIDTKEKIIDLFYLPYRKKVLDYVESIIKTGNKVLHISVHSFTPVLDGDVRKNDIGLLFDPQNNNETDFCENWKKSLELLDSELIVMFNYPYTGTGDGLTKYLRELYPLNYIGIEIEVNQKFASYNKMNPGIKKTVIRSFNIALETLS